MKSSITARAAIVPCLAIASIAMTADGGRVTSAQLGPRPFWLVDQLADGALKNDLGTCMNTTQEYRSHTFSIGHRGAPLQFPEHTAESYVAAARMGAGIIECDVTFTADRELVCRHSQCDLHSTTNILQTELAGKCSEGFTPAAFDEDGSLVRPASARCCTSDITLAEFKTLEGRMDASVRTATTIDEFVGGTAGFRTDLYAGGDRGTLVSHAESIELIRSMGADFTPELKAPQVPMPFAGDYTQEDYAAQLIEAYRSAGIHPRRVWPQSFDYRDVLYWVNHAPDYGRQAVYLDGRSDTDVTDPDAVAALEPTMAQIAAAGVTVIAPPMSMLLQTDEQGAIVPSAYADAATAAGLEIISWTTERSGQLEPGAGGFYYATIADALTNDGDILVIIDALARDVGIIGLFSDWPATTTFYANCKPTRKPTIWRLRGHQRNQGRGRSRRDD